MNNHKIAFIICTNSDLYYGECVRYLEKLIVPAGYEVEIIEIRDASSLAAGYNEGMQASDAKYKVYLHQDVFVLYPYFLKAILDIFNVNPQIGLIGMVGSPKMSSDGVMWHEKSVGNLYDGKEQEIPGESTPYESYQYDLNHGMWEVESIDGLMMITSVDIPWREDIFDGWDFYDASQSFEMRKRGYRIVVPVQRVPWVLHDDGVLNLRNYDKYRQIFLKEYAEILK